MAVVDKLRSLIEKLHITLAGVYSPEQLNDFTTQLSQIIIPSESTGLGLDQKDVMLITYANSIIGGSKTPIKTLHDFLNQYAGEAISAVHVLPFFPSTSDDGFSVQDYRAIDPELGSWDDIRALSEDFSLMFDGVINHASKSSSWFQAYLQGRKPYSDFFIEADPSQDYSSVVRPRALPLLTVFDTVSGPKHIWTTFSADQVDLNYRNPELFLRVIELLLFYVHQGASYIRLDAIGFIWKEQGTPCLHQPEAHVLVQAIRAVMDVAAPQVRLITETNVPHQDNISYFGNGENEAHLVYQFPLPPLVLHTLQTGNSEELSTWMASLEPCSGNTSFFNFLASHDGIGVRPVEGILSRQQVDSLAGVVEQNGGRVSFKDNGDGTVSPYELNISYYDALRDIDADDETNLNRFMAAQAILLSIAGVPGIYIHSLLGSGNDTEGLIRLGYNRAINREKLNIDQLEQQLADSGHRRHKVLSRFKKLLAVRTNEPCFAPAASQRVVCIDSRLITLVRGEQIAVVVNISPELVSLDTSLLLSGLDHDLLSGAQISQYTAIEPYQVMWLAMEKHTNKQGQIDQAEDRGKHL